MGKINRAKAMDRITDDSIRQKLLNNSTVENFIRPNMICSCRVWNGYKDDDNYGQIKYKGKAYWVHRISYAVNNGDIPDGDTIDHKCFNRPCIEGEHLQLLSHEENCGRKKK